jgi:receptor protein-tyrosine kinase
MSLIERAVSRLTGGEPSAPQPGTEAHPRTPAEPREKASTIEALMERAEAIADGDARPALEPAPAAPAARETPLPEPVRLNLESLRLRGFVPPDTNEGRISQEFRVIKRPLLANAFGKGVAPIRNGKRVMVTSSFPGEGKSFCAINLAMSIASERDHKVLLVDADVARPSLPRELGIDTGDGLMELLLDDHLDVEQFVLPTNVDKLAVLPAGRRHQQATELLASAAMTRLLEQISARYPDRIVIFDSPPLLVTTESRVLASYMGQIVLVVEAGKTPREAMKESLAMLDGSEVVGLVLNKAKGSEGGGYGGYYGYGYGQA